jgi:polyribonucleotide nucleotidyltransferase
MEFKNYKVFKYTYAGRPLVIETGKMAGLANGSVLCRYGDTVVLCCATASEKPRDGIDFLPLSVDFDERMYAAGKIPGGYLKREGKPSEKAVLTSRVIDRPIRPLFPKDLRNDVALTLTVMSVDPDCSPVGERLKERWKAWQRGNVMCSEMECAAIFVISSIRKCRASAIMNWGNMDETIKTACDAVRIMIEQDKQG